MELRSPDKYQRRYDEELGGPPSGLGATTNDEIVAVTSTSQDTFDIPPKNASIDRLRRWRVCSQQLYSLYLFNHLLAYNGLKSPSNLLIYAGP
jgi:Ca2+-ATPase N terminal autoinhibitory domain